MKTEYIITNELDIDSPALLVYHDKVVENMRNAIALTINGNLRPHVKTHKIAEVALLMLKEGITKFKCATIAEAEMLAQLGAKDILLAYQPNLVKAKRLLVLADKYPDLIFSCVLDNLTTAVSLSQIFENRELGVWIDVNVGMNRTGIKPKEVVNLTKELIGFRNLNIIGLHTYDGHIYDHDLNVRKSRVDQVYQQIKAIHYQLTDLLRKEIKVVAGGTPSFHLYSQLDRTIEVSPGTFIFWDQDYGNKLSELTFNYAAVILTRVISIVDEFRICVDLGHKSVASENPFPRVVFLNAPTALQIGHSEEHMVLRVTNSGEFKIGDTLYAVPHHICPTVALYERVHVVENKLVISSWKVIARDRKITI